MISKYTIYDGIVFLSAYITFSFIISYTVWQLTPSQNFWMICEQVSGIVGASMLLAVLAYGFIWVLQEIDYLETVEEKKRKKKV